MSDDVVKALAKLRAGVRPPVELNEARALVHETVDRLTRERDSAREAVRELVDALRPFAEGARTCTCDAASGCYEAIRQEKARALVEKYGGSHD